MPVTTGLAEFSRDRIPVSCGWVFGPRLPTAGLTTCFEPLLFGPRSAPMSAEVAGGDARGSSLRSWGWKRAVTPVRPR